MEHPIKPTVIDVEASGFGRDSYPIEVGVATRTGTRYCALIKPHRDWKHWSESAEAVHGITRGTVENFGKPIEEVCRDLNRLLDGEQIYSDAWSHDTRWLGKLFSAVNIKPSFSLRAIEHIVIEQQLDVWDSVKKALLKQLKLQRHRASSDAFLIQQTFLETHAMVTNTSEKLA